MKCDNIGHGICVLCENSKKLRNSHVVPMFHKRRQKKTAEKRGGVKQIHRGVLRPDSKPGGYKEYLLCQECENLLNKWETYAANWFYEGHSTLLAQIENYSIYRDIRYPEFRLYFLSILWRMSVSKQPYYGLVKLNESDEEIIRLALLAKDTLDEKYLVLLSKITNPDGNDSAISIKPFEIKGLQTDKIVLLINGLLHEYYINFNELLMEQKLLALRSDGTLIVRKFTHEEHPDVVKIIQRQLDENYKRLS